MNFKNSNKPTFLGGGAILVNSLCSSANQKVGEYFVYFC